MKPDDVSIIEACYLVEENSDASWLTELLRRARPSLDRGLGVVAYFNDYDGGPGAHAHSPVAIGCPDGWRTSFEAMGSAATTEVVTRLRQPGPVTTLSANMGRRLFARLQPIIKQVAHPIGMRDWLGIKVADPTGRGVTLAAPLRRVSRPSAGAVAKWSRIASHVAAGYRLRRRLASARPSSGVPHDWSAAAEAILQPDGRKVAEATGEAAAPDAREALLFATAQMDRARGRLRRTDPEEAVAIWLGLVGGRWSLVDQEDRDGRRYVLAYRNEAHVPGPTPVLTERERQVVAYAALGHSNKLIAYELGVAPSTVSMLLARAQAKLRAPSKNEMLALYRAAAGRAQPGGGA